MKFEFESENAEVGPAKENFSALKQTVVTGIARIIQYLSNFACVYSR